MKNLIAITSLALLSAVAQAESNIQISEAVDAGQGAVSDVVQTQTDAEMVHAESGVQDLNLWKILDVDKDGAISKEEAASSKEVFESWESLDANKDEKLDPAEFAQLFSQPK